MEASDGLFVENEGRMMFDDLSNNKLLRFLYPILFLIPVNFFIMSDGMGSGIQWLFSRYQTTFMGDSVIPIATSLNYVLYGRLTGKSALYEISPLIVLAVLFIAFLFAMANRTKISGVLTVISGIISVSAAVMQFGFTLHGPVGVYIPFGSVILVIYGVILTLSNPDPDGENLLIKYDYLFLLACVFLIYCNWISPIFPNDTIGTRALPYTILENHTIYLDETYQMYLNNGNPESYENYAYRFVPVGGNHYASLFPIVTPILITPLYAIPFLFNIPDSELLQLVMSHIASALIAALSVVFIYLACRYISSRKIALLSALVFAFATNTWAISSQSLYAHGMSELLLAVMIFLVLKNEVCISTWNFVFLGICSGLYIFNRPSDSLLILPVIGYVVWYHRENIRHYFLSAFVSGLPFLMYNIVLFRNPFGGYSEVASRLSLDPTILTNFLGLLIAPNSGLLIFTPVSILAVCGLWIIKDNNKPKYMFLKWSVIAIAITMMIYASFDDWQGGTTYGPRYLTCILPYLIIWLCIFFYDTTKKPHTNFVVAIIVILITVSVCVQLVGVFCYSVNSPIPSGEPHNEFSSYDPWDYTNMVIINSLYYKGAHPVRQNRIESG